jgi:hypothetical protein
MEEEGIRHQAVAVAEGGRPLQGREEVGWMVQAEVAKVGQAGGNTPSGSLGELAIAAPFHSAEKWMEEPHQRWVGFALF